jgi:membrane protease YdiL (CAAX protease family)
MDYILSPLKPTQLDLKKMLALGVITIFIGLAFGAVYLFAAKHVAPIWLAAALFHSVITVVIIHVFAKQGSLTQSLSLFSVRTVPTKFLYAPSVVIGVALVFALVISAFVGKRVSTPFEWSTQLAFILWIPVVEELVFRGGIGSALQKFAPGIWGMWFSAVIFAWVHTSPSLSGLLSGHMGLPLGPFFLGLICEYLRVAGGSLVPATVFHMVCNSTVVVFSLFDARWMDWLSWLYS